MEFLTVSEAARLAEAENIIREGLETFIAVGNALMEIRDAKLYRAKYPTFEEYCHRRWNLQRRRAYQLMDAAQVVGNLKNSPIGENSRDENVYHGTQILPANERQTRALSKLTPQLQREIWPVVVETAPNGVITAKHVEQVVEQALEKTEEETRRFASCPRCTVVTLEPGGVKKSCNICGWPGERKTSPPPQPSIEAEEGEEQESSDFDCPFAEKVVHVNGGAWCMACGVKWASVESFKLDYKNYKAQRDHQAHERNLRALEAAAGGHPSGYSQGSPEAAQMVLEMERVYKLQKQAVTLFNRVLDTTIIEDLEALIALLEDFELDTPKEAT